MNSGPKRAEISGFQTKKKDFVGVNNYAKGK